MTGETMTTSATGGQKAVKAERHDLIPTKGVAAIARVFGFGAEKYDDHNWRLRYEWSKSIASIGRHFGAFRDGETLDLCGDGCEFLNETGERTCRNHSGLPHLAHAGFHVLVLLTWLEEDGEGIENPMDDRWPAAMERVRLAMEPAPEHHCVEELGTAGCVLPDCPQAPSWVMSLMTQLEGMCPECEEFKFLGHGPLCGDCYVKPAPLKVDPPEFDYVEYKRDAPRRGFLRCLLFGPGTE
jgi:hypothetical protein